MKLTLLSGAKVLSIAALIFAATLSQAAVYVSKAGFLAANGGLTLQDFEGICGGGACAVPLFPGFTPSGPNLVIADGASFGAPSDWLADNTFNGNIDLLFNPSVNAVGFNLSAGFNGGNMFIDIFDGATLLDSVSVATTALSDFSSFFGIDGLGSISNLKIVVNNGGNFVNIDNLYFGSNNSVPEPMSLALVAFGLLGAVVSTRRRARSAS